MPARKRRLQKPKIPEKNITDLVIASDPLEAYTGLSMENRQRLADGDVYAYEGKNPNKPVLRWAPGNKAEKRPGSLVPGSGISMSHVDAANGRMSRIKNTSEYIALSQRIIGAEDGGAYEQVISATLDAAIGTKKSTKVSCPDCGHSFWAELDAPGDPRSQKLVIEMMQGSAVKRSEVDVNMKSVQIELSELVYVDPKDLISTTFREGLSREDIQARREYVDERSKDLR